MGNLVTGKVRFSYANVFEPREMPNGDEKYSVTLLIPKSDNDTYQRITAEINKILQEGVADTFKGVMPTNPKLPIHDGDGLRQSGDPYSAECKRHWVITANSINAPEVVDASCNPIISKNENDIYFAILIGSILIMYKINKYIGEVKIFGKNK